MAEPVLRTLGKYQLLQRLGRGGMAEVYRALQSGLERHVAIKVMHPHLADAPDFQGRFRREAQAVARLRHPHIVQVFDFDIEGDQPYMVMELVDGPSLKQRLDETFARGEQMPLPEVLRLFQSLLDAVGYAHRSGMVHRDLKPSNVMLDRGERPVLTDFGTARITDSARHTASGASVGTPTYMSPEQAQGKPGDARSDIYALGVMLYECLTGIAPFEGDSSAAVILKHLTVPVPSLRQARPDLPEAMERVVARAMAKDPAARYASTDEMWAALSDLAPRAEADSLPTPPAAPAPRRRRISWRLLAGLLVLAAGLGLAAWLLPARTPLPAGFQAAQAHLDAGAYQLAADAFSAVLETTPDNTPARLGRAQAYEQLGQIQEAWDDIEQAIARDPQAGLPYAERARLAAQYGLSSNPTAILEDFNRALELDPDSARAHFLRGWARLNFPLLDEPPDPAAAIADLQRAVELEPQSAEAHYTLGRALLAAGRGEAALQAARRAVELSPDAAGYKLRAHAQAVQGDFYAALDDLARAIELEAAPAARATLHAERAYLYYRLQQLDAARQAVQQAFGLEPEARLAGYVNLLLDPGAEWPGAAEIESARGEVREDPIWQAVIQDVLKR